jgi:DNA-binding protein HU-beta
MTKEELVRQIRLGTTKVALTQAAANEIVNLVFNTVTAAIHQEQSFRFPGFGTFTLRSRAARKGRNPQTGEALRIKASKTVTFRPATALKRAIARPRRRQRAAASSSRGKK